jgi:hypothetical protein
MRISFGSSMPPDLKEGDLKEISLLKWQLDCPRMTIKLRKKLSPETYYGAGRIFFTPEGSLAFECFSHREMNTIDWQFGTSVPSGRIIPDSQFYNVVALDSSGYQWHSSRTIPRVHRTSDGRAILRGEIDEISTERKMPSEVKLTGSSIVYWVFDDIKIPTNRSTKTKRSISGTKVRSKSGSWNAWEFTSNKIRYLLIKGSDGRLTIRIRSKESSFPAGFERRVVEAFHLILGRPINWMAMKSQEGQNIEIRIRKKDLVRAKITPPLPSRNIKMPKSQKVSPNYHRKLFHRFMRHTMDSKDYRHQIWGQLNAIAEASASSFIDAKALTLTVAIESLLGTEFPSLGEPTPKLESSIQKIRTHIKSWEGDPSIKDRVLSMIGNLSSASATDKMRALVDRNAITEEQYKAWKKLRNPTAHSYLKTGIATPDMIKLLQSCEVLFFHLIFHAIGYKGPYMDFSTPGWPLKEYPGNSLWT